MAMRPAAGHRGNVTEVSGFTGKGMNILDWLCILFVYLKITDQVDWSWWWVTAPIWGSLIFVGLVVLLRMAMR